MRTAFLRPRPGIKIRRPERLSEHLPADGATVTLTDFWRRRITDGDVEEVKAPPAPHKPAAKPAAKKEV